MTEFTKDNISAWRIWGEPPGYVEESLDEIERLQQRIAELEQERRWIPVSERLPESGERVLVRMSNFYIVIACYFGKKGYWKNDSGQEIFTVTHWQPLPKPPESED